MKKVAIAFAPAAVLLVIAGWSTWRVVGAGNGVPGDAAWRTAASLVRKQHLAGELIVFAPEWISPVGRLHLGDLIPIDMASRLDAGRYSVIHELSIRGARAAETRGLRPVWQGEADGVTVRRFERAPATLVTDLVTVAQQGRLVVAGRPLRPPEVVLAEVGFDPHRCVQVVPSPGSTVTLTFANLAIGTELVGGVGLADVFKRREVRTPIELTIAIGTNEVARVRAGVDDGWVTFRAATTPRTDTVTVTVQAIGTRSIDRLACFAVETRR